MLPWLSRDPDEPTIWHDLKSGDAGWLPRLGLSLAAAGAVFGIAFLFMGLVDETVGAQDEHIAVAVALSGAAWCVLLALIWMTFGRWHRVLKTIFSVLGVWIVAIPSAFLADSLFHRSDFFIAAALTLGIGATTYLIATTGYRRGNGRAIVLHDGVIDVRCPECGYFLVGLSQCVCPECGTALTIDELIRRQNYRATSSRAPARSAADPDDAGETTATDGLASA